MGKKLFKFITILISSVLTLLIVVFFAMSVFNSPVYAWRILTMGTSDTGDINRFPVRAIANGPTVSPLPVGPIQVPAEVTYLYKGKFRTENLQELIRRTETAAFIMVRDDRIILQVYHNSQESTPHTSFSVSKSFTSALIGAALIDSGTRRNLMRLTGWLLFAIGGIIPLIWQINSLPIFLLFTSAIEIFFQNFLTGVVSARLIRDRGTIGRRTSKNDY